MARSKVNVFITGTDTNIGKTITCAVLLDYFKEFKPFYYKPVQTGVSIVDNTVVSEDITTINLLTGNNFNANESNSYILQAPMSPYQASKREGVEINLNKIRTDFEKIVSTYNFIICEGVGGVLVPVTKRLSMIDVIKKLNSKVVVTVSPRLGTLNHSLLTFRELARSNIEVIGFIMNNYPSIEDDVTKENPIILEEISGIKYLGRIMHAEEKNLLPRFHPNISREQFLKVIY